MEKNQNNALDIEHNEHSFQAQEPRLPQIDPVTFSALSMLDGLVARAALTRQEHAEANKSLQHIVQTVELLQAKLKELARPNGVPSANFAPAQHAPQTMPISSEQRTIAADAAEEMFKNGR